MLYLKKQIEIIENLLEENTIHSLTYAALECRLTIETICYERWLIAYDYLPYNNLRKWQPRDVIKQVVSDVNEMASEELTISFAPIDPDKEVHKTIEEAEKLDFVKIGKQSEINVNKLGKFWNAISNVALHVSLPESKKEELSLYGNKDKIIKKIKEIVSELKKISEGNLIIGSAGKSKLVYSFNCENCHSEIQKSFDSLKETQIVNCISPSCIESYIIEKKSEVTHSRHTLMYICQNCSTKNKIPYNFLKKLKFGMPHSEPPIICIECEQRHEVYLEPKIRQLLA